MDLLKQRIYTKEEYFELAEQSYVKLEFHDGEIYAMSGGTSDHSLVSTNTRTELNLALRERNCVVYDSGMAVFIENGNRYVYPDISVVCGPQEFQDEKRLRLLNPSLIIEVLSEPTEAYDRGRKFGYYRSLPCFQEYILISSTRVVVEGWCRKSKDLWQTRGATSYGGD